MKSNAALADLRGRTGLTRARATAEDSDYARGIIAVIDAVTSAPERLWRPHDMLETAGVVSSFNLDRILIKTIGYDFAELVDRARVLRAVNQLGETQETVDAVAEGYWPLRTKAQQIKELQANIVVKDNKLSSRENLDGAFRRTLGLGLEDAVGALRA